MARCQQCKRPTPLYLCNDCLDSLANMLDELPWLIEQLDITATRQDQLIGLDQTGRRAPRRPAELTVINTQAADLARQARATLLELAETVAHRHGGRLIPCLQTVETSDLARWLTAKLDGIARLPTANRIYKQIQELTGDWTNEGQIHHAINRQDRRYYGPCATIIGRDRAGRPRRCGHDLYAPSESLTIQCPRCRTPIDPRQQLITTINSHDLVTEPKLVEALDNLGEHVPWRTLHEWIRTERLQARGYIHNGRIIAHRIRRGDPRVFSITQARQLRSKHAAHQH